MYLHNRQPRETDTCALKTIVIIQPFPLRQLTAFYAQITFPPFRVYLFSSDTPAYHCHKPTSCSRKQKGAVTNILAAPYLVLLQQYKTALFPLPSTSLTSTMAPIQWLVSYDASRPRFNPHTSILHQLPAELLSDVFLHTLSSDLSASSPGERPSFPDRSFLFLCEVDRYTRHIAIHTPELWTFIRVFIPSSDPAKRTPCSAIPCWLERSGALPLHLELCQERVMSTVGMKASSMRATRSVFKSFGKAFWHCIFLRLDVASRTLMRPILPNIATLGDVLPHPISPFLPLPLPSAQETHTFMLESLDVNFIDIDVFTRTHRGGSSGRVMTFNLIAPRLRRISGTFILDSENWQTSLPWHQLTDLSLQMNDVASCIEVLTLCPLLVQYCLDIDSGGRDMLDVFSLEPVLHTVLRSFTLHGPVHDLELLFLKLVLPSLVHLEVEKSTWAYNPPNLPTHWPHQQFIGMIERSGCVLESLKLLSTEMSEDDLKELSKHSALQNVRNFGMGEQWDWPCKLRQTLLMSLTMVEGSEYNDHVLKSLDTLSLTGPTRGFDACDDGLLAKMVLSRCMEPQRRITEGREGVARLQTLIVELAECHEVDRAALEMLQEKGLIVTFL
ncbi:hypothetical protein DL96DRAFT_424048 [Flagelloscypha sp. PMI_526]|nr:hypothetical protein DL96DRAFT_424048 [Flagelloscypha sp. PMI_526]